MRLDSRPSRLVNSIYHTMNSVRSLERGLEVLRGCGPDTVTPTVHDMARRARMPRSSVYRFIKTLVEHQFIIERDDLQPRRYVIGPAIFDLARVALGHAELSRCAHPIMTNLAERVGESVSLSVRQD